MQPAVVRACLEQEHRRVGVSVRRAASTQLAEPALTMTTSCTRPAYDRGVGATEVAEFGFPGLLRDGLVDAIVRGEKTATTGLLEAYRREGAQMEAVGSRALVVDSAGRGVAVIETTEVEVKRMGEVDVALAQDEGEGFETVEEREAHVRFFTSPEMVAALGRPAVAIDDDTLVVCSRFRVVELIRPTHARGTICVDVDDADEVRAPRSGSSDGARLRQLPVGEPGCGCRVDIWDVLGPRRGDPRDPGGRPGSKFLTDTG